MSTLDHELEVEVQSEEAARVRMEFGGTPNVVNH